ncbi:MAG TPA: LytTR family DNA-binding domain-containing protein [Puia sp.]|uniref:LytR/AlgR family response regulator transcription factor n=1 Tax=Puia sp. TaxID=2045100 RepID=UPI002CA1CCDB|nr:LytTR family DNA-binding domain-containing protein [Puia sp.]HVU98104.1 LytTR family DNA-binding domain-containing protein [Puia sp.]
MLKCIIVEDETLAQDVIKSHLSRIDRMELVGVFRTGPEAMEALQTLDVDVIFLDIRLPGISGLHFLRGLTDPPLVVLTTAYAEYALESYEFNVIDYLLKPISFERFSKAVNKLLDGRLYTPAGRGITGPPGSPLPGSEGSAGIASLPQGDHIFVKSNSKFFRVNFSEITYVEGMKDYLKIHTPDYTLVTHQTMNELEKLLPARLFIRVHRSYLVAIAHIRAIYGNSIELGKVTIPIGVNYKEAVMALIGRK